jgi:DedD protein
MGLFSFFKRSSAAPAAGAGTAQAVDAARTRARRRLIGAVLLLGIGVIAFPLLFETQPRPIPVDIPIEIPRKEGAPPLAVPAPRPAATPAAASRPAPPVPVLTESKADAGKEVTAAVEAPVKPAAKPEPAPKAVAPPPPSAPAPPPPKAETPPAVEAPGRFVVQVGAFADVGVAREARAKVEKLGLRTYTQAVETDNGKRIRVRLGPFPSRDDAEKAAAKVKAAGLPAAVLTL